ncbi:MAG: peptidyl-prolyl cis-trans isomerase [Planctomycetales bacterium]|nr:peptidyl-prolyl cis-trans isomerase [Planctomycetales bacterium]
MIRPNIIALAGCLGWATITAAQVPGFPAFGQGPQGPPSASFPGARPEVPPVATPSMPTAAGPGGPINPEQDISFFEPGKLVARVGDQPVFYGEILGDLNQIVEAEMPTASPVIKEARRQQLFNELLPKIVEQKMVYVDFLQSTPQVEQRLPEIMDRLDSSFYSSELPKLMERLEVEDQRALEEKLRQYGSSLRNVKRAWIESQIVGFFLGNQFTEEREVTHQELLDYYRDHQEKYAFPARVRWEELVVRYDAFADRMDARRALEEMGNEVVFGAPLDAVARRRSQGPTASLGGTREWVKEEDVTDAALRRVLFSIRIGYLSDITETVDGLRIVRVIERESASVKAFRDVQSEITEQIQIDRRKAKINDYLNELKERVPVWTILDEPSESRPGSSTASPFPGRFR